MFQLSFNDFNTVPIWDIACYDGWLGLGILWVGAKKGGEGWGGKLMVPSGKCKPRLTLSLLHTLCPRSSQVTASTRDGSLSPPDRWLKAIGSWSTDVVGFRRVRRKLAERKEIEWIGRDQGHSRKQQEVHRFIMRTKKGRVFYLPNLVGTCTCHIRVFRFSRSIIFIFSLVVIVFFSS